MENWNSANHDLFYGKDGDLTGSDRESQEVSMLALHLLQSALVHVNTLLLQDILSEEKWQKRLTDADRRALSPLFWMHVNPYGRFELDMNSHLALAAAAATVPGPRTASDSQAPQPAHRVARPGRKPERGAGASHSRLAPGEYGPRACCNGPVYIFGGQSLRAHGSCRRTATTATTAAARGQAAYTIHDPLMVAG